MTAREILNELKSLGNDGYKRTLLRHGVPEPFYGVKIEDLKKIQKRIKMDYQLAKELFDTGVADAMYLAGLVADDERMTKKDLHHWAKSAACPMHSEYTVAWVAAGNKAGWDLALEWIESKRENVASTGWATLSSTVAISPDTALDLTKIKALLGQVVKSITTQPNRVRFTMNGFVIAVGCHVSPLTDLALEAAARIGTVTVAMGDTDCRVPSAAEAIKKVQKRGALGKKRKSAKC
jgi:3-methyladenine DNA glycosylase AlkD